MPFCPHCGHATNAGASFCGACGKPLVVTAPAPTIPGAPPISGPTGRPVGMTVEPWLPIVLTLVTFGIYGFFYWWRVSKETDAYAGTPENAHKMVRIATILGIVGFVGGMILSIAVLSAIFAAVGDADPDPQAISAAQLGALASLGILFPIVMIGIVTAYVLWIVAMYRVWRTIENAERAAAHPNPLSPGLQLLFVLLPYVNFVTFWIALYKTQDHLNALWARG